MSELSKFINLLVEYEEKIEGHLNKKYKPFLRKMLNQDQLHKTVSPDRIVLSKELIVFKLGLEAKSSKAIEISLNYLVKMFQLKFIDLNQPNYCQHFSIEQSGVKQVSNQPPKTEVRQQMISLIKQNLHYKNNDINLLIVKVLQFLITEPILDLILDITTEFQHDSTSTLLFNYFSFRFHVYEEICYYSEAEMKTFTTLPIKSQKIEKEIKRAQQENDMIKDLVGKYMQEYLSIIDGSGGRYGSCVMCGEPAQHFCKITKASLCGMDCKKKHIDLAQKQYRHQFQATHLWQAIYSSFKQLLTFLRTQQSPLVFSVLANLLDKPYLFMIVKKEFRKLIGQNAKPIFNKVLLYRNQNSFEHIYYFMASLTKHWLYDCLSQVQYFFKEYIVKILEEKKPTYRFINLVFKALARIFQHGKITVQLYINFDCEINRENVIQKILFELAKIAQDRFWPANTFSKTEKSSIKNHSLSLLLILAMGLNEYRKTEYTIVNTEEVIALKQKKMSLEQFVVRFNQHWTSGLKTLFNLNLVGLDSNQQIVDIFMILKGLNKEIISDYFSCEKGFELFEIFLSKIVKKHPQNVFLTLLQMHHYIPLKSHSICLKKLLQYYRTHLKLQIEKEVAVYMDFLCKNFTLQDFKKFIASRKQIQVVPFTVEKLYIHAIEAKQPFTFGKTKTFFTNCCSRSYLQVVANQLTLLQIPVSYLLENNYEIDRLLTLTQQLVQICPHSNWLSLLIKNSLVDKYPCEQFDQNKMKIVTGALNILQKQAAFVQDWSTIIQFLSQLRLALLDQRKVTEGRCLNEKISVPVIQRIIMEVAIKAEKHFGKLLVAILVKAKEEIQKENLFMAQKFFQIVDSNPRKFMNVVQDLLPFLEGFTKLLTLTSPQICISVADMLKQSFAKLLKIPKTSEAWANGPEAQFWKLFQNLTHHSSKDVKDFVVNCMTMAVLHHYQLGYKSWIALFKFMKQTAKDYRQQIFTIIEKIIAQKLKNCEQFYPDLIDLCLQLVHQSETKISFEALHALKHGIEIVTQIKIAGVKGEQEEEQRALKEVSSLIIRVQQNLIDYIFSNCHQEVMNTIFRLLGSKAGGQQLILSIQDIAQLIGALFNKIQEYSTQTLQISQKTINFALNWSVTNRYSAIIDFLTALVIDKYNELSLSAIKCIKTYLQIVNPRNLQEWQPVQNALLSIAKNCRISSLIDLNVPNKFQNYEQEIEPEDGLIRVDLNLFGNKMVTQKLIVEMMPNHRECLEEVNTLYTQAVSFNDNLYLRCLLWRAGLGNNDGSRPPNLLSLQDTITGKMVSIYNSIKEPIIIDFSLNIFKRYCKASQLFVELTSQIPKQGADPRNQSVDLIKDYLQSRKVPLIRVMSYFLPKYPRFCKSKQQRKEVVLWLVESLKYVPSRQPYLKCIKQLTKRQS